MKKSVVIKVLLIIAYTVLLAVTVSFAWILNENANVVDNVNINYDNGKLVIAPTDISAEIYMSDEDGRDVLLNNDFSISPSKIVPNSIVPFKIRLKNNSNMVLSLSINLVGVESTKSDLLKVVYVSATPTTGWTTAPQPVYKQFGDATESSGSYTLTLMHDVTIYPTGKGTGNDYSELSCYLYFDGETMTNEFQSSSLKIGAFRISQV